MNWRREDQINMTDPLQHLWQSLQLRLFPMLEEELGPLSDKDRLFVQVVSLLDLGKFMSVYQPLSR